MFAAHSFTISLIFSPLFSQLDVFRVNQFMLFVFFYLGGAKICSKNSTRVFLRTSLYVVRIFYKREMCRELVNIFPKKKKNKSSRNISFFFFQKVLLPPGTSPPIHGLCYFIIIIVKYDSKHSENSICQLPPEQLLFIIVKKEELQSVENNQYTFCIVHKKQRVGKSSIAALVATLNSTYKQFKGVYL